MYDEMDAATRTYNHYKKTGRIDEAIKFGSENIGLLLSKKPANKMKDMISNINQQMQMVYRNRNLSADKKRDMIKVLTRQKNMLAMRGYEALTQ